jgi:sarcosine oxidase subunit gamma
VLDPTFPAVPALAGGASLLLAPPCSIVSVAAFDGQAAALGQALGVALPTAPRVITQGDATWAWSGVESWLAIGEDPDLVPKLAAAAGTRAAVVDQSHGKVILHLAGPRAPDVLAKLVPIDLHPSAFPADATALTLAGPINVQLWRHGPDGFALACMRSLAQALGEALAEAAAEYATEGLPHG